MQQALKKDIIIKNNIPNEPQDNNLLIILMSPNKFILGGLAIFDEGEKKKKKSY